MINIKQVVLVVVILTGAACTSLYAYETEPSHAKEWVKVRSGLRGNDDDLKYHGTGTPFEKDGEVYVLTSEHVVFQERFDPAVKGRYQHFVQKHLEKLEEKKEAFLVAFDWAEGAALLWLKDSPLKGKVRKFDDLFDLTPLSKSERLVIAGFPIRSDLAEYAYDAGSVWLIYSRMRLIPNVPTMIEIWGSHGEFGMSGAPVYRSNGKGVVAMLSHQYLQTREGNIPLVRERTEETQHNDGNHLLAIPAKNLHDWLVSYFKDPKGYLPSFVRDPDQQWSREPYIYSAGLKFSPGSPIALDKIRKVGGEGIGGEGIGGEGIGGEGIGGEGIGGEGIGGEGIGGTGSNQYPTEGHPISIMVERDDARVPHLTKWPYPKRNGWKDELRGLVRTIDAKSEINLLWMRVKGRIRRVSFSSLGNFFTYLYDDNTCPVRVPKEAPADANRKELVDIGKQLIEITATLSPQVQLPEADRLLDQIQLAGQILWSNSLPFEWEIARLIPSKKDRGPAWDNLLTDHGHNADQLIRLLTRADNSLLNNARMLLGEEKPK